MAREKLRLAFCLFAVLAAGLFCFAEPVAAQSMGIVPDARDKNGSAPENQESEGEFDQFEAFEDFEEFDQPGQKKVYDPLSGYNRAMTTFNDKFYFWVLKPAATGYAWVAPQPVRTSVHRFFRHWGYPVRVINNLLQLKGEPAADETIRFAFNSTVGLLGFFDPAKNWLDLEPHREDFGQTLGSYGVGDGFPLVLPFFGPSNVRDSIAMVPDLFLYPLDYLGNIYVAAGLTAYERLNYASLHLGEYEKLKKDSLDWYIFLRNAYQQNREQAIKE